MELDDQGGWRVVSAPHELVTVGQGQSQLRAASQSGSEEMAASGAQEVGSIQHPGHLNWRVGGFGTSEAV